MDDAMVFDTANPTGGDWDLGYANQGNAIIISEDGDAQDPDDEAYGGTITFEFEAVSDVTSLTLLDIEEEGGAIDLFDVDGELIDSIAIPAAGNNSAQDIPIGATGAATMTVTLAGSGAVDDLCYATSAEAGAECGQYAVTYADRVNFDQVEEQLADTRTDLSEEDTVDELALL